MNSWIDNAIFYHIYPLGALGAPKENDYAAQPINRLGQIHPMLDHIQSLGANALYLGPLFESASHGYDTTNYYEIDRRLGTRADLATLSRDMHARGMHLILDGVFNHVGRDFWAFQDVLKNGQASQYKDWFSNLRFDGRSPYGDPFVYDSWNGHFSLVKLNLENPAVVAHLFGAIRMWFEEFQIDGLRLDAADAINFKFLRQLRQFCSQLRADFWLLGEVIHGDYRQWANPGTLQAVTNYELYKGLYSSHNDHNYFELAYALRRQFAQGGLYEGQRFYNFVDNHDVTRIASQLSAPQHLYPLHILLFSVPGIPALYYGSEFGILGRKNNGQDYDLRPLMDVKRWEAENPSTNLTGLISQLSAIIQNAPALRLGDYQERLVASEQVAFSRSYQGETVFVAVNSSGEKVNITLKLPGYDGAELVDLLNPNQAFEVQQGVLILPLDPCWGRILRVVHG